MAIENTTLAEPSKVIPFITPVISGFVWYLIKWVIVLSKAQTLGEAHTFKQPGQISNSLISL